jgi:hypothetical protein
MRIGGVNPASLPAEEILVLPRGEEQIVFRARGLSDMDEFDKLCPEPDPPVRLTKAGKEPNEEDANWQSAMLAHGRRRVAYMVVKSLQPSNIEWDTVDPDNPKTWTNYTDDLRRAGFSQVEVNRIVGLVWEANCLDEAKLEQARQVFLHGQQLRDASSGPSTEPPSTPSGEPASDSVSGPQA